MSNTQGLKASVLAANLIEAQVKTLPVTIAALSKTFEVGEVEQAYLDRILHHRKLKLVTTASGGNIVAEKAEHPDKRPADNTLLAVGQLYDKQTCIHLLVGNSLVTVGTFMQAHDMLDMRTPEFQFLGHVVDAILNAYTFNIKSGYMPVASFDGLVIDSHTNGMPVFSTGTATGFMEVGDALALLEWMSRYLRGERSYVSGGDAG